MELRRGGPGPNGTYPQIAVVIASEKDYESIMPVFRFLDEIGPTGIPYEVRVLSAYRTPQLLREYCEDLKRRGIHVVIAASGGTNELALNIAGHTILPVVALPLRQKEAEFATFSNEMAALTSTLETPEGYPVPSVGFNHAVNAAFFAVQVLATKDARVSAFLEEYRQHRRQETVAANDRISREVLINQERRRQEARM
jgi:5-(carboxyamino)imidazole ribonucleotide mutase